VTARLALCCAAALATGCDTVVAARPAPAAPAPPGATEAGATTASPGCLATGDGYLRARLRGALELDVAWSDPGMDCDGGVRPDGRGLRVTVAGPPSPSGRRLRFVFGIADVAEGAAATARPTNLTILFEGEQRVYATRGDDKCTIDELRQERVGALGGPERSWRVVASGFCIGPASAVDGSGRILVTRFDFATRVRFGDDVPHGTPVPAAP
jgi:hypothetical protein